MTEAGKQSRRQLLMLGLMMVFAAATASAVPLAEKVVQKKPEKVSVSKALHYIENRPEANPKAREESKEGELPLLGPEKLPASEPLPLELKGVRG
ncbi:MAG: hypothetical protein PHH36_12285 [Sideroxydans sp.]|nr:hypothetical protein [Sideroxydans sp.]